MNAEHLEGTAAVDGRRDSVCIDSTDHWTIAEALWLGMGYHVLALLLLLLCFIYGARSGVSWAVTRPSLQALYGLMSILGSSVVMSIPISIIVRRRWPGRILKSVSWNVGNAALLTLGLGVATGFIYSLVLWHIYGERAAVLGDRVALTVMLSVVSVSVVGPFIEELYFRGILYDALEAKVGGATAAAVSTALFSLVHPKSWFLVLPVAIVLGIVRLRTKSVAASFAFHAAYNMSLIAFQLMARS